MNEYSKMQMDFLEIQKDHTAFMAHITQLRQQVDLHQHLLQVYGFGRDLELAQEYFKKKEADEEAQRTAYYIYWRLAILGRMLDKSACRVETKKNEVDVLAWFEPEAGHALPPSHVSGLAALRPFSEVDTRTRQSVMGYMDKYRQKVVTISDEGLSILSKKRENLLASQQLAIAKWGSFTVKGSDKFVRDSIRVAVENGLQGYIRNPELLPQIEYEIARQANMSELYPLVTGLAYDREARHGSMVKDMEHSLALMRQALVDMRKVIEGELRRNGVEESIIAEDEMIKSITLQLARMDALHEAAVNQGGLMPALLQQKRDGAFGGMEFKALIEESKRIFASSHYIAAGEALKEITGRWVRERHLEGVAQGREKAQTSDARAHNSIDMHTSPALAVIAMGLGAAQALKFGQDAERVGEIEAQLKIWRMKLRDFESVVGTSLDRTSEAETLAELKTILRKAEKACLARTASESAFELISLEYASSDHRLSNWPERFQNLITASLPRLSRDTKQGVSQTAKAEDILQGVTKVLELARKSGLGAYLTAPRSPVGVLAEGMHYTPEFFTKHHGEKLVFQEEEYTLRTTGHHPWGSEMAIGRENSDGSFLPLASLVQTVPSSEGDEPKVLVVIHQKGAAAALAIRGLLKDEFFGEARVEFSEIMWNFMEPHTLDGFEVPRKTRSYAFWDHTRADEKYVQALRQYGVGPRPGQALEVSEDISEWSIAEEYNQQARKYNTLWHQAYEKSLSRGERRFTQGAWEGKKSQIPVWAEVDADRETMQEHPEIVAERRQRVGDLAALIEEYAAREAKSSVVNVQRECFRLAAQEYVDQETDELSAWFRQEIQSVMGHSHTIPTHEECREIYKEGAKRMAIMTEAVLREALEARLQKIHSLEEGGMSRAGEEDVLNWTKPAIKITAAALSHVQANAYARGPKCSEQRVMPDKEVALMGQPMEEEGLSRTESSEQSPVLPKPSLS